MANSDFKPGLEGVMAFETEIAEPDKDGGSLRYRGVDIEELVGHVSFGNVWGLLVDNEFDPGLPPVEPSGSRFVPVMSASTRRAASRSWARLEPSPAARRPPGAGAAGRRPGVRAALRVRRAVSARRGPSRGPAAARGRQRRRPVEAFLVRWRGEPDPRHMKALDAYWVSAAEHGMNASTFTARVIASTGADVAAALSGAIGALSGPLHGGAPARVLHMIEDVERTGDAEAYVRSVLDIGRPPDGLRPPGVPGGGSQGAGAAAHRRSSARRGTRSPSRWRTPRSTELADRQPDRVLETNVEFWAAIVLDFAQVPADITPSMFTCARTAGWAAHIMEQKLTGRLVRPSARYIGPGPRPIRDVQGAAEIL